MTESETFESRSRARTGATSPEKKDGPEAAPDFASLLERLEDQTLEENKNAPDKIDFSLKRLEVIARIKETLDLEERELLLMQALADRIFKEEEYDLLANSLKKVSAPEEGAEPLEGGKETASTVAGAIEKALASKSWSKFREKIAGKIKPAEIYKALKEKQIFGVSYIDHLKNIGTGVGVRTLTRWGLGFLTGGAGYALAVTGGAVSGAVLEGRKAYKKEMSRERTALSDEDFEKKISEFRGKKIQEKLESYLASAKLKESQIWTEEKNKLRQELEKTLKSKEAWAAFRKGALQGAFVGALGGALGGALSDLAGHFFAPEKAVKTAGLIKEAARTAKKAGGEILERGELESFAADAYNKTLENSLAAGLETLKEKSFSVSAEKGEGATHLARKLIHDYIVQSQALGSDLKLDKARLVYAEDYLKNYFTDAVIEQGSPFATDGQNIADIVEKAKNLSEAQLENIKEKYVPKIAEKTWLEMTDYNFVYRDGNNVASEALINAQEKSAEAANKIVKEAAQMLAGAGKIPAEVIKAKDYWFKAKWIKYGLIGAGLAGGAATAYKYREPLGKAVEKDIKAGGEMMKVIRQTLTPKERTKLSKSINLVGKPKKTKKWELPKLKWSSKGEKRGPDENGSEPESKPKPEIDKEKEKKVAADPLLKFYREHGVDLKPGELTYRGPKPKDIDKGGKAEILEFDTYSDFRKYWENLTPEQKRRAPNYIGNFTGFGIWAPKTFWEKVEANPDLKQQSDQLQRKALGGFLVDDYLGLPEKEYITFDTNRELRHALSERIGHAVGTVGIRTEYDEINPEEELEGIKKLEELFKDGNLVERLKYLTVELTTKKGDVYYDKKWHGRTIPLNPALPLDEMRRYLEGAAEKAQKLEPDNS